VPRWIIALASFTMHGHMNVKFELILVYLVRSDEPELGIYFLIINDCSSWNCKDKATVTLPKSCTKHDNSNVKQAKHT
jgi:hypothetical protein